MKARPMIIGTKICPALLGLRPIDSIAEAAIRPWPRPLPKAAIPTPMLAPIAMSPPRHSPPAFAASCAIASSGDARMAIPTIVITVPIRRNIFSILLVFRADGPADGPPLFPLPPPFPGQIPVRGKVFFSIYFTVSISMILARSHSHVTHRKSHEHDRLDHANNRAERVKRQRHE